MKIIYQWLTLLLVPCLILDPAWGCVGAGRGGLPRRDIFSSQALAAGSAFATQPPLARLATIVAAVKAGELNEASAMLSHAIQKQTSAERLEFSQALRDRLSNQEWVRLLAGLKADALDALVLELESSLLPYPVLPGLGQDSVVQGLIDHLSGWLAPQPAARNVLRALFRERERVPSGAPEVIPRPDSPPVPLRLPLAEILQKISVYGRLAEPMVSDETGDLVVGDHDIAYPLVKDAQRERRLPRTGLIVVNWDQSQHCDGASKSLIESFLRMLSKQRVSIHEFRSSANAEDPRAGWEIRRRWLSHGNFLIGLVLDGSADDLIHVVPHGTIPEGEELLQIDGRPPLRIHRVYPSHLTALLERLEPKDRLVESADLDHFVEGIPGVNQEGDVNQRALKDFADAHERMSRQGLFPSLRIAALSSPVYTPPKSIPSILPLILSPMRFPEHPAAAAPEEELLFPSGTQVIAAVAKLKSPRRHYFGDITADQFHRRIHNGILGLENIPGFFRVHGAERVIGQLLDNVFASIGYGPDRRARVLLELYDPPLPSEGAVVHLSIQQTSCSEKEWSGLKATEAGFRREGVWYFADPVQRVKDGSLENEGGGFLFLGELMTWTSVLLRFNREAREPHPLQTDLFFWLKKPSAAVSVQNVARPFLDLEKVAADGYFSAEEAVALRNAASQVNVYVQEKTRMTDETFHRLHRLASEGIPFSGYYPAVIPFPDEFRGHYRPIRRVGSSHDADLALQPGWVDILEGSEVQQGMNRFLTWLNYEVDMSPDPIALASEAYVRFIKIHPYLDLSDRLGWLIANWVLLTRRLSSFYVTKPIAPEYRQMGKAVMRLPLAKAILTHRTFFKVVYHPLPHTAVPGLKSRAQKAA